LETLSVILSFCSSSAARRALRLTPLCLALSLAFGLAGCNTLNGLFGDRADYRTGSGKTAPLEVPPDLTQLSRDARFAPQGGVVSASSLQGGAPGTPAAGGAVATVAPLQVGDVRIERQGDARWLVSPMAPDQVWPMLQSFWQERGFTLVINNPEAGVMETDWAENRAKLPDDIIRNALGRVFDSLYSTGERDRFRVRVERTAAGSEIYLTHRGLVEVFTGAQRDQTMWTNRPTDRGLESEMLARIMVRLGAKEDAAKTQVAATTPPTDAAAAAGTAAAAATPPRARLVGGQPGAAMEVDDGFERAWRRVGLALDRGSFTVEDRDRANGTYYVRYVDPKSALTEEPGFFSKLFGSKNTDSDLLRYRITVKAQGEKSQVAVLNAQGAPDGSDNAQRIVTLLVNELK
jgi:outer membrane protein assembly factor BamC